MMRRSLGAQLGRNQRAKQRAKVVPGFTRTSGNFGRFSGRSGELKYKDFLAVMDCTQTPGSINGGTDQILSFCRVPQGTGPSFRIGRKITIKKIFVRGNVTYRFGGLAASTENPCGAVRVILYVDKQTNGAAPNLDDLLTAPVESAKSPFDVVQNVYGLAYLNLSEGGRFRILKDKKFVFNSQLLDTDEIYTMVRQFKWSFANVDIPISYSDESPDGALNTIKVNNIGMFVIIDDSANENMPAPAPIEANRCILRATVRIRYAD